MTKLCLLRQKTSFAFCRDKQTFVETKDVYLSRQKSVCRDKSFVATSILLSRQTIVSCFDKTFVATKTIHVAAPANDRYTVGDGGSGRGGSGGGCFGCVRVGFKFNHSWASWTG